MRPCYGIATIASVGLVFLAASAPTRAQIVPKKEFTASLHRVYEGGPGGGEFLGYSLAGLTTEGGAFDFDGDGFMDYVIGAPFWSKDTGLNEICHAGRIYLCLGAPQGPPDFGAKAIIPIDCPPLAQGGTPQADALFGFSVSGAFDVERTQHPDTGDYMADIIVGMPGANVPAATGPPLEKAGMAWIIPGRPDAANVQNPFDSAFPWIPLTAPAPQAFARFGHSVSYIGGDTGTGGDDVLVGAPYTDVPDGMGGMLVDAGEAYAFGAGAAPAATGNALVIAAPTPQANALFGYSVSGAGLFTPSTMPDTFDVIIGEPGRDMDTGAAYVFGRTDTAGAITYFLHCALGRPGATPGDLFGFSVTDIGDFVVGLDARDDVAVGAPGVAGFDGAAFVYTDVEGCAAPFMTFPGQTGAASRFGWAVSGGMNADGLLEGNVSDELLVGAPFANGTAGVVHLYLGTLSTGALDQVPDCILTGLAPGDWLGAAASEAYNVDQMGSGVADEEFLVGGPRHTPNGNANGGYAVLLDWTGTDCAMIREFTGTASGERRGFSVTMGADWNGDDIPEILAGAPFFDFVPDGFDPHDFESNNSVCNSGRVYVLDGATQLVQWILEDPDHGEHSLFGFSMAVGQFVGTHVPDIWVGAPYFSDGPTSPENGRIALFDGRKMSQLPVGEILNIREVQFTGSPVDKLGYSLANGGLLDDEEDAAFDDVIAGATRMNDFTMSPSPGRVSLFKGAELPENIVLIRTTPAPEMFVNTDFGFSVARVGHLEPGSTRDEYAVGAPRWTESPGLQPGKLYIFRGETGELITTIVRGENNAKFGWSLAAMNDVTGDGWPDLAVGAPSDNSNHGQVRIISLVNQADYRTIDGTQAGSEFGFSISSIASIDDYDTLNDLIIGAPKMDTTALGFLNDGRIYFYRSDGTRLFEIHGEASGDRFGFSVSRAGLIAGDPVEDALIGAPLADVPLAPSVILNNAGKVYIYDGDLVWVP